MPQHTIRVKLTPFLFIRFFSFAFNLSGERELAGSKLSPVWHLAPQWPLGKLWLMAPPTGTERQRRRRLTLEKTERMISHFPLGCSCLFFVCLFGLVILNVRCFIFSYRSALVIILFVWLAECTDARVKSVCVRVRVVCMQVWFYYWGL